MDGNPILSEGLRIGADLLKAKLTAVLSKSSRPAPPEMASNLDRHLKQVESWSGRIQMYGMSSALDADSATLPLSFQTPRRFKGERQSKGEIELLADNEH